MCEFTSQKYTTAIIEKFVFTEFAMRYVECIEGYGDKRYMFS